MILNMKGTTMQGKFGVQDMLLSTEEEFSLYIIQISL